MFKTKVTKKVSFALKTFELDNFYENISEQSRTSDYTLIPAYK